MDDTPRHEEAVLADLTEAQRQAVLLTEGPLLVLAAAGSGKTRVITRRVAQLISIGIPAWQILALTFTNKAAGEMRERVETLLAARPEGASMMRGLTVSTFHALCARLLRRYLPMVEKMPGWAVRSDFTIYDASDQLTLMKRTIEEAGLSTSSFPARAVLAAVSDAKNRLEDHEAFAARAGTFQERTWASLYPAYDAALGRANAVDFDDLLVLTVRLLRTCADAREEVQARWRYLMIDEYQDTNHVQFVLSTLLCGRDEDRPANVCVVGDPDQSIYGWRGADIANILEFEEYYPEAQVVALGENFRSTSPILAIADALIRHNSLRKHKDLFTRRRGGSLPVVVHCRDEHHEAALITDWFRRLHGEGDPDREVHSPLAWKDMAVFYRNNALSRVMEDGLRRASIPYVIARGTAFYEREEVRDALAYLRLAANLADDVSLQRIVNKPARKIGKTTMTKVEATARLRNRPLLETMARAVTPDLTAAAARAVRSFVDMVMGWTGQGTFLGREVNDSLADFVGHVLKESGLERHYIGADGGDERVANLNELVSAAREFEEKYSIEADAAHAPDPEGFRTSMSGEVEIDRSLPPLLAMLRAFLETVALVADADRVDPANGAVTLMTLHAAKGLEFPAVAIIGLEEGLLPGMRAIGSGSEADLEEERRLCFVGITRAQQILTMTCARYRMQRGQTLQTMPSRFLAELPEEGIVYSDQSADRPAVRWDEFDQRPATERRAGARDAGAGAYSWIAAGAGVRHPQFGAGRVLSVSPGPDPRARIVFQDCGTKTIILKYAKLEPFDLSIFT